MNEERWYLPALLSTFFIALTLRLILPLEFNVWGPDTGENYYIASYFAGHGAMPVPYYGFGRTYTEFPVAYQLVASIARLAGISTASTVALTMPFLASFAVFPVSGIAVVLTRRKFAGVLSALFYAASTVVIGHTSIMSSDTLGEVLLLFFIYFYIHSKRDLLMTALAFVTGLAMIPSYHLGTVFMLLYVYATLSYHSLFRRDNSLELLKSMAFILVLTTLTWVYWITEAPVFLALFVLKNPHLTIEEAILAPYLLAFVIFIAGAFVRIRLPQQGAETRGLRPIVVYLAILIGGAVVAVLAVLGVPSVPIYPSAYTLLNIPTVVCTLLGFVALFPIMKREASGYPLGFAVSALVVLILIGVVTSINFLVPERVAEYVLLFIALFAGGGMLAATELKGRGRRQLFALVLSLALVLAGGTATALVAVTTTPSKIGATPAPDLSADQWLGLNTPTGTTVASDHRLSSLVFGFADRNATWEKGSYPIFSAGNTAALLSNLNMTTTPSGNKPINYLMLDTYMVQGANFYPNQTAIPVSPAVLAELQGDDFILLYSNGFSSVYGYAP